MQNPPTISDNCFQVPLAADLRPVLSSPKELLGTWELHPDARLEVQAGPHQGIDDIEQILEDELAAIGTETHSQAIRMRRRALPTPRYSLGEILMDEVWGEVTMAMTSAGRIP